MPRDFADARNITDADTSLKIPVVNPDAPFNDAYISGEEILDAAGVTSTAAELNKLDTVTATAAQIEKLASVSSAGGLVFTEGVSFTEDGSGTSYVGTVVIPAGAVVHEIAFTTTVLWDGTSATLKVGDDDDDDGYFTGVNLKATDLVVGEVLSTADDGLWGGVDGAYLTTAGRRGQAAGGDSGFYYGGANNVIFTVTPGAADGSAGRSFGWVRYSVPTFTASTNT